MTCLDTEKGFARTVLTGYGIDDERSNFENGIRKGRKMIMWKGGIKNEFHQKKAPIYRETQPGLGPSNKTTTCHTSWPTKQQWFTDNGGLTEVDNLTPSINHVAGASGKYFFGFVKRLKGGRVDVVLKKSGRRNERPGVTDKINKDLEWTAAGVTARISE